jgi:hypothetical protein
MKQLIIFSLEPLPTRYTQEWFTHLPKVFKEKLGDDWEVKQIDGETLSKGCSPGGFLDFSATNIWKCEQIIEFFLQFNECGIQDDAVILFTDAWHPGILQVKYTKDLLKTNWKLISFWHAGSYIDSDPLGQLIEDKSWSLAAEESFFNACDINVFATMDHLDHFWHKFPKVNRSKAFRSGFPMEYIYDLGPLEHKHNIISFAARNSPEKHPELFELLEVELAHRGYEFINCQAQNMTKAQYHETLAISKIVISFAELETLGIVQAEALQFGAIPLVPNWLCYPEEYPNDSPFLFDPCNITTEFTDYFLYSVKNFMDNYINYINDIEKARDFQKKNYFSCDLLIDKIRSLC